MLTDISIIIPCYNTPPAYLEEAISSVLQYAGKYIYLIIIVNDGSTDLTTLNYLENLKNPLITVISQNNKGLAGARNTGIIQATSEYLLFLDGDDKIKQNYIDDGITILKLNKEIGVVYSNAEAFGDESRANFTAHAFDITSLLLQNHIPSCVVMRKKAWQDVSGFDEQMRKYEDWEFWIRIHEAGWKFYFIKKPMFDYRIHPQSLLGQSGENDFKQALEYIYKKHWKLVHKVYHKLYATSIIYKNDKRKPLRSFIKYTRDSFQNVKNW